MEMELTLCAEGSKDHSWKVLIKSTAEFLVAAGRSVAIAAVDARNPPVFGEAEVGRQDHRGAEAWKPVR
jgi:hypothetical protein